MFKSLSNYIQKMFQNTKEPQTYGSALEQYIVSKNPQTIYEVEYWTRQFDDKKEWSL
jgi:hypothetical protein